MNRAIRKYATDFIAVIALALIALVVAVYIVLQQDARPALPFVDEEQITLKAQFTDAQAVVPGQGQSVRIAGVQVGKITGVALDEGLAIVTMDIERPFFEGIHSDASALLRPRTGLKDMFVELDPGTEEAELMPANGLIPIERTAPDIDPDEILAALDTDTRAYLKLLVNGAGKGLDGRGNDLREVFKRFEPLHRDVAQVNGALSERREQLARLIHNYGQLTTELANNDADLEQLVRASNTTFAALASQDVNISRAVAALPGALNQTRSTLVKVDRLGEDLGPTLNQLRPAIRELDEANEEVLPLVRQGEPQLRNEIRPFVRRANPYVGEFLRPIAENLTTAMPELTTSFLELNRFFNMLAFNPAGAGQERAIRPTSGAEPLTGDPAADRNRKEGHLFWLHWVAANSNSLFSTRDANGPYRRVLLQLGCRSIQGLVDIQTKALRTGLEENPATAPLAPLAGQFTTAALTLVFGQNPETPLSTPLCAG